jgi:hypothetical protein
MKGCKLQKYWNVSELVDPRPNDGDRFSYYGKPILPVAFECDWMMSSNALQRAVAEQMFFIGCEE